MWVLTLYKNGFKVCRGVMGCQAWANKIAPVLLGMGYAVKVEKVNTVPERGEFERKKAEAILNEAYAKFDNLYEVN